MYTIDTPSALRFRMISNSASTSRSVSDAVGSSMMRMRALNVSAFAISTSCFCAMPMSFTFAFRSIDTFILRKIACTLLCIARWSRMGRKPNAFLVTSWFRYMFSRMVISPKRLVSWYMIAMPFSKASLGFSMSTRCPATSMVPLSGL